MVQEVQKWFFLPDGERASKWIENRCLRIYKRVQTSPIVNTGKALVGLDLQTKLQAPPSRKIKYYKWVEFYHFHSVKPPAQT